MAATTQEEIPVFEFRKPVALHAHDLTLARAWGSLDHGLRNGAMVVAANGSRGPTRAYRADELRGNRTFPVHHHEIGPLTAREIDPVLRFYRHAGVLPAEKDGDAEAEWRTRLTVLTDSVHSAVYDYSALRGLA